MLNGYHWKTALIDADVDDDLSEAVDILGYEVVAICAPSAVTGTPTINKFQIDPGDGTFRDVVDSGGTDVTMGGAIAADEIQIIPATVNLHLVGAYFKFGVSAAQGADRTFYVLMKRIE